MLTARSNRFQIPEAQHQNVFGGGIFGGGIFVPGSGGGFSGPAFGPGGFTGATGGAGGGFLAPVMTLQTIFGQSFSAATVADAIEVAAQRTRLESVQGEAATPLQTIIDIATSPTVTLVLNTVRGLFEILSSDSGNVLARGVTPEAALEALRAGGGPGIPQAPAGGGGAAPEPPTFPPTLEAITTPTFVEPPQPPASIATPENLRFFLGLVSDLFRRGDDPLGSPLPPAPAIPTFPPFPTPNVPPPLLPGPPRVEVGGTVNVPVVLGSTGDPTGVRRPRFPNEEQLSRAQQIGQIIRDLLALRKARQNADKQRRAFEQFLRARLAQLGGQQMPFGQAGFSVGGGPLLSAPVGALLSQLGQAGLGALGGFLGSRFGDQPVVQGPATPDFPLPPGLGGGGGGCPTNLFRMGGSVLRMSPVPWFPVQAPNGKWFFFGHLGTPTFSKLKARRRHHHHSRKR